MLTFVHTIPSKFHQSLVMTINSYKNPIKVVFIKYIYFLLVFLKNRN